MMDLPLICGLSNCISCEMYMLFIVAKKNEAEEPEKVAKDAHQAAYDGECLLLKTYLKSPHHCIGSGTSCLLSSAVFLYCCPACLGCLAHLNSIGWATLAIWAINKYSFNNSTVERILFSMWGIVKYDSGLGVGFKIGRSGVQILVLVMCGSVRQTAYSTLLGPPSCNGYLVHRSKVGSIVAGCCRYPPCQEKGKW